MALTKISAEGTLSYTERNGGTVWTPPNVVLGLAHQGVHAVRTWQDGGNAADLIPLCGAGRGTATRRVAVSDAVDCPDCLNQSV